MKWTENLPRDCPPKDAKVPDGSAYYRLVGGNSPVEEDFYSQRKLYPNRSFNSDECQARALSVFKDLDDCKNLRKLPVHKGKTVLSIIIPPDGGLIKKTGKTTWSHYSWWIKADFDPIPYCRIADDNL